MLPVRRLKRQRIIVSAPSEPKGDWTFIPDADATHVCARPALGVKDMETYPVGSVWQCRACETFHVIDRWVTPGGSQDFVPDWKVLDARR